MHGINVFKVKLSLLPFKNIQHGKLLEEVILHDAIMKRERCTVGPKCLVLVNHPGFRFSNLQEAVFRVHIHMIFSSVMHIHKGEKKLFFTAGCI